MSHITAPNFVTLQATYGVEWEIWSGIRTNSTIGHIYVTRNVSCHLHPRQTFKLLVTMYPHFEPEYMSQKIRHVRYVL